MWLALPILVVVALAIVGGLVVGGIYLLFLLPVVVIAVVGYLIYVMWNRSTEAASPTEATEDTTLPHSDHRNTTPAPATPDDLVDARRQQQ